MPLSVTCQCGARLEIDEKFLGKVVPCPDCNRPLPTSPPPTPPPLDLPDNRRVSGLAVLSLALALVGAFTIVGTLAAIVVGLIALKRIAREPTKLEGANFARAGIITGAVCTVVMLAAMLSPVIFIDVFLRDLVLAQAVENSEDDLIQSNNSLTDNVEIRRPSRLWTKLKSGVLRSENNSRDMLILVDIVEDAYIGCMAAPLDGDEKIEDRERKVLEPVYKSELMSLLSRLRGSAMGANGTIVAERKPIAGKERQEIIVDLRDRRLLIQYTTQDRDVKATILVGCARRNKFDRLQEDFRKAFDSFKNRP